MFIIIKDLELKGRHGVLPPEKLTAQNFMIDAILSIEDEHGTKTDCLSDSVDYALVCELIANVVEKESYNLIERLADRVGEAILVAFRLVSEVEVTVKKLNPPMKGSFKYMAVQLKRKR